MFLPELIEHLLLFFALGFGILSVFLILNLHKTKLDLTKKEEIEKQKAYQASILKEIQNRTGYSLDIEEIADVIINSLKNLFSYSTASSLVIKDQKLIFKVIVEEQVSHSYISQLKQSMLNSLSALTGNTINEVSEEVVGLALDDSRDTSLSSFFHIPLTVKDKVLGLISVSSTHPNLYKEDEMTLLYQIISQASEALSRLQNVLDTEKGKLSSMISGLADGVFMVDDKKQLMLVNTAAKDFLGIESKDPTFSDLVSSFNDHYDIVKKLDEALVNSKTIEEKEVTIKDKVFQLFITPVSQVGERSEVIGASVLLHDITLEKQISNIKEDFTNMMVHDLRAPLTSIKYASQLILQDKDKFSKEEETSMIEIVEKQSITMLDEISTILDAAKIESGRFSIQKSPSDLVSLIDEVISNFKSMSIKKQVEIEKKASNIPQFSFDRLRIEQVLNNLLSNSFKFTEPKGKIIIEAVLEQKGVKVSVIDTGSGIPKDQQKDLFSKFYQIRKTPHELARKGSGLGLYTVKGIVEAHGGSVGVESDENKGTRIFFFLPNS